MSTHVLDNRNFLHRLDAPFGVVFAVSEAPEVENLLERIEGTGFVRLYVVARLDVLRELAATPEV